jgi:predicted PurR-regulated permease PerM
VYTNTIMIKNLKKDVVHYSITTDTFWRLALVALFFLFLSTITDILLVLCTSLVIAAFMQRGARKMERFGLSHTWGIALMYIVATGIFIGIFFSIIPLFNEQIGGAFKTISRILPDTSSISYFPQVDFSTGQGSVVGDIAGGKLSLKDVFTDFKSFSQAVSKGLLKTASGIFGGIAHILLIFVISLYLSLEDRGVEKFLGIVVPARHEDYVIDLWRRVERKISYWAKTQVTLGFIFGLAIYIVLRILGVQYAFVLAVISGILEMVPFGFTVAGIFAALVSFVDGGISLFLKVGIAYILLQTIENNIVQPLLVKKMVGISPVLVILSLLVGSRLAGLWGIILALPSAILFLEIANDIEQDKIDKKRAPSL